MQMIPDFSACCHERERVDDRGKKCIIGKEYNESYAAWQVGRGASDDEKEKIFALIAAVIFAGTLAGGLLTLNRKPKLYYDGSRDSFAFLENRFDLTEAPQLLSEGICAAEKGDVVALIASDTAFYPEGDWVCGYGDDLRLMEELAPKGPAVLIFSASTYSRVGRVGTLYRYQGGKIKAESVRSGYDEDDSRMWDLLAKAVRDKLNGLQAVILLAIAGAAGICALVFSLGRRPGHKKETVQVNRPSGWKRAVSVAAAAVSVLFLAGWTAAWNIYAANHPHEKISWEVRLLGIPFMILFVIALLNLFSFRKYCRWLNILSLVFGAVLILYLVAGLMIALIQGTL